MGMTDDQREAVIESSGGASVPVGFGVFVQHGELRLADEHAPRGLASDAGRELARLNRSRTGMPNLMKPWPALVAVTREPTVTLHVVSALESLAAAGVPTYLVARKAGAPMLPAPSFAERVHAHQDISGSAIRVLQELEGSVKSCPSLSGMLEVLVVGADPRQVASKVQEIVPTGLAGCACDADTPTLYRLWTELLFQGVAVIGKRVTLETGPKAALVQVEGLDGAAFYDAMPSDGRPVRFR